jgi:Holliday junction resolvasome RuvABC endonuclease subunit
MTTTVIGLDLSLTSTGMSDGATTWLITSKGHKGDDLAHRGSRLRQLRTQVLDQAAQADLVVIEGPSLGQARQGGQHDRAGLWWQVIDALQSLGVAVAEVPPATLKRYATGKGNANKGQMIEATTRRAPDVDTAGDDNRCDAFWLAALGHDHLGQPVIDIPAAHRAALDAVRWPGLSSVPVAS